MSTIKYTAGSLMLWACFSARGPEYLVQIHGIMDSIKYQQIQNQNLTFYVRNLIMGRGWILHQDQNKPQNESFAMLSLSSDLNPTENECGELKRRSTNTELWIWRDCMKEWTRISYQVLSKLFRQYKRELDKSCYVGKRTLQ